MSNRKEFFLYTVLVLSLIIVSVISFFTQNTQSNIPYAIDNSSKDGTMALANVLSEQNTNMQKLNSISEIENINLKYENTAIVIINPSDIPEENLNSIEQSTHNDIFFLNMQSSNIENIQVKNISQFTPIKSQCNTNEIKENISISSSLFSLNTTYQDKGNNEKYKITKCFPITQKNDIGYALIQKENDHKKITYIADASIFTNKNITKNSNAYIALNLFQKYDNIYWYISNIEKLSSEKNNTTKSITPPWTNEIILILLLSGFILILANTQRIGKVVKENLPVLIKNEESIIGKANLYRKNSDQNYIANILRIYYRQKLLKLFNMSKKTPQEIFLNEVSKKTNTKYEDLEKIFYTQETRSNEELHILLLSLESIEKKVKDGKQ